MTNTEILNEYFIWEENNSIEPKMKSENKTESEQKDSMTNIKIVNEPENWRTITDPKLRKKMKEKSWRTKNKDRANLLARNWVTRNKDKVKMQQKIWREQNRDRLKDYHKDYQKNYRRKKQSRKPSTPESRQKRNIHINNCKKNDPNFKLQGSLRSRLRNALKGNYKSGSAVRDLGCSIESFKAYLESKFQTGMTWDNHGQYGWHIDHIKPLSSFDLTDRKQLLEACHYTNLQPLWAADNLSKYNKSITDTIV